jgi:hypothetical protein
MNHPRGWAVEDRVVGGWSFPLASVFLFALFPEFSFLNAPQAPLLLSTATAVLTRA